MRDETLTEALLGSIIDKLRAEFGQMLEVDYYPEDPQNYRLNHARGALLLGYAQSTFGIDLDTQVTWVQRELNLPLTLVFRQLRGPDGVVRHLDMVRQALAGFVPAHCDRPLRPLAERFLAQQPGIWQYAQELSARTVQVQHDDPEVLGAALQSIDFDGAFDQ